MVALLNGRRERDSSAVIGQTLFTLWRFTFSLVDISASRTIQRLDTVDSARTGIQLWKTWSVIDKTSSAVTPEKRPVKSESSSSGSMHAC